MREITDHWRDVDEVVEYLWEKEREDYHQHEGDTRRHIFHTLQRLEGDLSQGVLVAGGEGEVFSTRPWRKGEK